MSIIEVLIAVIISAFAIMVSSAIIGIVGRNIRSTESIYDVQNAIDQNISAIESAADRYTCNQASCTVVDNGSIPAKTGYIDTSNSASWNAFLARCNQETPTGEGDLLSPLKSYIEDVNKVSIFGLPSAISRTITVHGSDDPQGLSRVRHMTIQYRDGSPSGKVLRDVTIMPTIVSYCP